MLKWGCLCQSKEEKGSREAGDGKGDSCITKNTPLLRESVFKATKPRTLFWQKKLKTNT
jgi:hypothetical protein